MATLRGAGEERLDLPALDLASIEFPGLVREPYLDRLDEMAGELGTPTEGLAGPEFIAAANEYLYADLGFRGNERDYYDPRNSCLNAVLDQRTGLPITLSLVYLEIARRIGRPMFGIGLPGHFIVQYDDGDYATYLDPFHGGKLLSVDDCREIVRGIAGDEAAGEADLCRRVGPQYILTRMLHNLRSSYFRAENFERAAAALDLLVEVAPRNADYYKHRGVANVRLRRFRQANADFERYLALEPEAADRKDIVEQMAVIQRWLGALN